MPHTIASLAFAVCGSVIGAGFASGREMMSFFARYGRWSYAAVACALLTIAWAMNRVLCSGGEGGMPERWRGKTGEKVWRGMFLALMVATGGAMLSGSGEIAALMLPLHGAQQLGMAATLVLACLLEHRGRHALTGVSRVLVVCLLVALAMALRLPRTEGVTLGDKGDLPHAVVSGVCYGSMNLALAVPALCGRKLLPAHRRIAVVVTSLLLGVLLLLGNELMLRHPELSGESLPTVRLLRAYGLTGYRLCGLTMYMAVFTTLLATLRGVTVWSGAGRNGAICVVGMIFVALLGFHQVVHVIYPLLGAGCFVLLLCC